MKVPKDRAMTVFWARLRLWNAVSSKQLLGGPSQPDPSHSPTLEMTGPSHFLERLGQRPPG
jgi:hypothetical protein